MRKNKMVITSYVSPDLDGVAAMYAYAEYLNKKSKVATYCIEGMLKKEVEIVSDLFNIRLNGLNLISDEKIVIVDTNHINRISKNIILENVIEIIDHHPKSENIGNFINAKVHIEIVGAVATLIAEKFYNENIPISRESAILLYYGIILNTINLKSKVISKKDIDMSNWLKSQYSSDINDENIRKIFLRKTNEIKYLRKEMEAEFELKVADKISIIGQLELVDADKFVSDNFIEITRILKEIKKEKNSNYIFLNCIDILKGYSFFVYVDKETEIFIEKVLKIKCHDSIGYASDLIVRKQIINIIKTGLV